MDVRCDRCETEYELDDGSVSDAGTSVQCTTCGHTFIVARRPSSPLHQVALTPPAGMAEPSGPAVPEWTLSTDDGKVHRFRDLNTLQKWIVERKAGRTDRLSRAGGPWLALGEMDELASFFNVVDEADRARAAAASPARPTPPAPMPAVRAPSNRIDAAAAEARRPVQSDGPTVPNRQLPDVRAPSTANPRRSDRTPAVGTRAASGRNADGRTPPPTPVVATPVFAGSGAISTSVPRRIGGAAASQPQPGIRGQGKTELVFPTDTTVPVEGEFSLPTNRNRNVFIAVAVVAVAAGGAYVWSQQGGGKTAVVAEAPAPAPTKAPPVAAETPAKAAPAVAEPPPVEAPAPSPAKPALAAPTPPAAPGPGRTPAPPSGKLAGRSSDAAAGKGGGPGNYDRLVSDADRLLERGQGAKAEKLYEQALNAKPDGVAALTGIAYVLLDKQRHFKAIDMFRRALDVQPTFGPALFGIAESYRGRGDLPQALGAYRQYLAISPSGSDAPAARRQVKDLENVNTQASTGGSASKKDPSGSAGDE